jgi:hypothetical protein
MKNILLFCISCFIPATAVCQETPIDKGLKAITTDAIKAQVSFLSSDWMEGREAGEKGGFISSDYIASMLELYGLKPGGDYQLGRNSNRTERSFFQNFVIIKTEPGDNQILKVKSTVGNAVRTIPYIFNLDYSMRSSGQDFEIEAPVVFAGYAFRDNDLKYDDFSKIDVRGKFILKISGIPRFAREKLNSAGINAYYAGLESTLINLGAAGILEYNPDAEISVAVPIKDFNNMSPAEASRPAAFRARYTLQGKSPADKMIRATVSSAVVSEILKGSGISVQEFIKKADENKPFNIPSVQGKSIYIKSDPKITPVAVRNVIGIIEGNRTDQVIVLGAHYDHMGIRNGYIWNGADDNASGTVGIMTMARAILETGKKPEKTTETPYFRELFSKPFSTFVLMTFRPGPHCTYQTAGMKPEDVRAEQETYYAFTRFLLTKYKGTNKTFILQNWEGDWVLTHPPADMEKVPVS